MLDVIILGAGAAGISAANILFKNKLRFKVLEARNRIGGRAHTLQSKFPIELGPEFVHGEAERVLDLLQEHHLYSVDIPDLHHELRGKKLRKADFWDAIAETLKMLPRSSVDCSIEQGLLRLTKVNSKKKAITRGFIQGFDAAMIDEVSMQEMIGTLGQVTDPEQRKIGRTLHGYSSLFKAMAKPFEKNILYGSVAEKVKWEKGAVEVEVKDGSKIRAKAVLITLPVGVLKSPRGSRGHVIFSPEIHQKSEALHYLEMGPVVKVMLQFKNDTWTEKLKIPVAMFHSPQGNFQTWWTAAPMRWPLITAWSGGDPAEKLSRLSFKEQTKIALKELAPILGLRRSQLESNLEQAFGHDWSQDSYSRGAYSFVKVNGKGARKKLGQPIKNTLFFAGEATSEQANGTVEGAIETGERAAKQIIKSMQVR